MGKKKFGLPFQEGYTVADQTEVHIFTDYRWNDGSVSRRWHVDPIGVEYRSVEVREFSVKNTLQTDQ
ncbi:hypothetical protein PhaeoP83_04244 (plasmid) [Phaeobacter inhibens]|uniref:Uncharacterized protein n=1 Tax=Phaeobacter inhibens TaxID=221822 RepID=A0ABN5GUA0_9RHOB|nr:hypothetical protein PhaeoP83_04244 [Phaeobacter inhibens]AUQ97067.1 hypothetical protein PhaeoP66_04341 [Phaeobacter inhibens]AUR22267.1 hypothetical protein PhaeoP80_04244 [Phaeobacter inhibens]